VSKALPTTDSTIAAISAATQGFGGFLRCEMCGRRRNLGNIARHYRHGWPRCCGYTMRWWTQRQIDAGEVGSEQ
jgi:hypothetical protein